MQQVTLEYLEGLNACLSGIRYYQTLGGITDPAQVIRACIRDEKFSHARWLMARLLDRPGKIAWAIFSAEQVIEIYEKRYPGNKAPRNAIEAAKAVLQNDSPESREAARVARRAADATYAYAAYAAAYAAADAADAAAYAADAADAADAASRREMRIRILEYGITLLEKEGK